MEASYFDSLSAQTGITARELRLASVRQRAMTLTPHECAKQLRIIARTDTQMFASERAMLNRAAQLLENAYR